MDHLGARLFIIQVFTCVYYACAKYSKARYKNVISVKLTNQISISNSFLFFWNDFLFCNLKTPICCSRRKRIFLWICILTFYSQNDAFWYFLSGNIENVCFSLYICYSLLIWFQERRQYKQEPSFLRLLAYFQHINGALL